MTGTRQLLAAGIIAALVAGAPASGDTPAQRWPNRWDSLARMEVCDWLSTDEIRKGLGLSASLQQRRIPARCDYVFQMENGRSARAFSLYVEVHDDTATVRNAESDFTSGFTGSLFKPLDAGSADLHVYVSKKGSNLYVFPEDGITLWRLEYLKDSPAKVALYGGANMPQNPGEQFMQLLVNKYEAQL